MCELIGVLFPPPWILWPENGGMFLHEANKYWEHFCYYVLVVPRTSKKVFSRSNFSDNSMQVLSLMHSNVQLLYLLFAIGVAVLVAKGP